MSDKRTLQQNKALHAWFRESADECLDAGVTVNDIIGETMQLQVDEDFIKWLFKRALKKLHGKKSTTELNKSQEIDQIIDNLRKFFAEKVDPPIELPPFAERTVDEIYNSL